MRLQFVPILAIVFSGSVFSFTAYADEKRNLAIEEVVVTARKQEESVQDVPIAITALTAELQNSSIRDLKDINGYAPNVIISENGSRGGGGADINIRGISPTRSDDNSFDAPIAVVIDDIYLGTAAGQILENFDLERIEILRGPQGTLFGKNTVGGVINVVRSRPTGETGGRFKATVGPDGQQELRALFNTAISDELAVKLFGSNIQYDGYRGNSTTGNDIAERDYQNYGATFLWEPNDRFDLLFTAEVFRDEGILDAFQTNYNTPAGLLPAPPAGSPEGDFSGGFVTCLAFGACRNSLDTPSTAENDKDNKYSLDTDAYTLKMTYELNNNITLVSITGYRDVEEYRIYDLDASAAPFITIERWNEYDQLSQEFRLDGQWDTVTLTAGLYYYNSEFEQDYISSEDFWGFLFGGVAYNTTLWPACQAGAFAPINCDLGIPGSIPTGDMISQPLYETQETTSYAAYAQMDWQFTDQWILTAGLRYTREEKHFIAGQGYLTTVPRQHLRNFPDYADLKRDWNETSPKLGLTYEINDDSMMFITYSEGFHSGGFFGVNQNKRDFERDQYDPEFAKSWELGYKSQHMDDRLRFNLTYFRNDFTDKQESFIALDPETKTVATVFDNAANVIYQGWELETQFVFNEYLRGFFNYGYLDAEYEKFETDLNPNDDMTVIQDATHLTPRQAPESVWGLGGTLTIPVGAGAVEVFLKYTKIAELEASLLNLAQSQIDDREDVTATIGYYTEDWSVSVFGRNLTDDRFETFLPIATLFAFGNVNRPRSYGFEFSYDF